MTFTIFWRSYCLQSCNNRHYVLLVCIKGPDFVFLKFVILYLAECNVFAIITIVEIRVNVNRLWVFTFWSTFHLKLEKAVGIWITMPSMYLFPFLFLGAFAKFRKATISFVMSVRLFVRPSAYINSAPTGRVLMTFDIWIIFYKIYGENSSYVKMWQ